MKTIAMTISLGEQGFQVTASPELQDNPLLSKGMLMEAVRLVDAQANAKAANNGKVIVPDFRAHLGLT